ncbi:helix-turn-helix transcriptional regulator [Saccharopolyspora griseoalba]|uniref:NB-ARC domain-containing protein n=1 Tax=Saccharopolyspora griseoalba TaxID=1431848 RepID=A0ABW2LSS7_9PSEU
MAQLPAAPTTFVGRDLELATIEAMWESGARLMTLAGPGGAGKSTLAIHASHQIAAEAAAEWVDLENLRNSELLAEHVAEQISAQSLDGEGAYEKLLSHLARQGRMLLVLDNCEHLHEDLADLCADMLDTAPQLVVLATSRRLLTLDEEHKVPVEPLSQDNAVELFCTRARAVAPESHPELHVPQVRELVEQVDRLPAGIEILAARARSIAIPDIAAQLDKVLASTAGDRSRRRRRGRQRGFAALLESSWELCSPEDQALWSRSVVFGGAPWTLEAAEAVCSGPDLAPEDVVDTVQSLVDQSLLSLDRGTGRYRMLSSVQRYGREQLEAADELDTWRARHAQWVRRFFATANRDWGGPHEVHWLRQTAAELANARAAMDYLIDAGRLVQAMELEDNVFRTRIAFTSGSLHEWCYHLDRLLGAYPQRDTTRANALAHLAYYAVCMGQPDRAGCALREAIEIVGDSTEAEHLCVRVAEGVYTLFVRGDPRCVGMMERAYEAAQAAPASAGVHSGDLLMLRMWMAICQAMHGARDTADQVTARLMHEAEATGAAYHISWMQWARAVFLLMRVPEREGALTTAETLLRQALPLQRSIADFWGPLWWLLLEVWRAVAVGHYRRAAEMAGATQQASDLTGIRTQSVSGLAELLAEALQRAEEQLGAETYRQLYERGAAVRDYGEAISLCLSGPRDDDTVVTPVVQIPDGLAKRTQLVRCAKLVAAGLSNAEIAEEMGVAPRTVKRYVTDILATLGVTQREQVAAALGMQE